MKSCIPKNLCRIIKSQIAVNYSLSQLSNPLIINLGFTNCLSGGSFTWSLGRRFFLDFIFSPQFLRMNVNQSLPTVWTPWSFNPKEPCILSKVYSHTPNLLPLPWVHVGKSEWVMECIEKCLGLQSLHTVHSSVLQLFSKPPEPRERWRLKIRVYRLI